MLIKTFILFFFVSKGYALSYEHMWHGYVSVHVLSVDPNEHSISAVKASFDTGRETVQDLAKFYEATAGINGGFWKTNGDPAGILKIEGTFFGLPNKPRGAIGWSLEGKKVCMDRVLTSDSLKIIPMSNPPFTTAEEWEECDYIVGGTPLLLHQGRIIDDYHSEQTIPTFLTHRHARTGVGIRPTGEWIFVIIDSFPIGGMTILELAHLFQELGCIQAVNLDGGSSSTLIIEGRLMNTPKHIYAEAVSDAILIY
jgi:exopolysaccharide biosynthesis protein